MTKKVFCSGCGKELRLEDIRIMGPDTLHPPLRTYWCYNPLCITKQRLFNAAVQRKLAEQGRGLIRDARASGDKELEEVVMLIYMSDKMEMV